MNPSLGRALTTFSICLGQPDRHESRRERSFPVESGSSPGYDGGSRRVKSAMSGQSSGEGARNVWPNYLPVVGNEAGRSVRDDSLELTFFSNPTTIPFRGALLRPTG